MSINYIAILVHIFPFSPPFLLQLFNMTKTFLYWWPTWSSSWWQKRRDYRMPQCLIHSTKRKTVLFNSYQYDLYGSLCPVRVRILLPAFICRTWHGINLNVSGAFHIGGNTNNPRCEGLEDQITRLEVYFLPMVVFWLWVCYSGSFRSSYTEHSDNEL